MTIEIGLVLGVTALTLILFVTEQLPMDVVALLSLVTLVALHLIGGLPFVQATGLDLEGSFPTPAEALSGASNPATITILCMFVLSAGLQRTGWIDRLGQWTIRVVGRSALRQVLVLGTIVGLVSGVLNNTAVVAMMLPLVIELSRRTGVPAGRLLIPLSFCAMLGGTLTLIGTSTNILAAGLMLDLGGPRLGVFSITGVGALVLVTGLVYFAAVGFWLLPRRRIKDGSTGDGRFLIELEIHEDSPLVGQTLEKQAYLTANGLVLRRLLRRGSILVEKPEEALLEPGDVLMVEAEQETVLRLARDSRARLQFQASPLLRRELEEEGVVARVLINAPLSARRGHLRDLDLEAGHRATIVGLHHSAGEARRLGNLVVRRGESLLLFLPRQALQRLRRSRRFVVLEHLEPKTSAPRARTALAIVVAVMLLAATSVVPIAIAALAGVLAMLLAGCLEPEDAYAAVSWDILVLLAAILPLGITIAKSGTADWLAGLFAAGASSWPPFWIIFGLYLMATLSTEVVSNSAAVVVLVPVAMSIANKLGLQPVSLVLAVMFGASTSFLSPIGYQTNTLVYATGVYRFRDFFVVGAPLNLLTAFVTAAGLQHFFPVTKA